MGTAADAIWGQKSASWFTSPKNERISVILVGFGNLAMASTLAGSLETPEGPTM